MSIPTSYANIGNTELVWMSCRYKIKLSHILDDQVGMENYKMFEKYFSMWDDKFGTIKATEHCIDLEI